MRKVTREQQIETRHRCSAVQFGSRRLNSDIERLIIDAACNGSRQAWRQLFEWHFDAVFHFCRKLTAGRSDWADDVCQQTFVAAAQTLSRFEPDRGTFRVWLFGIARNRCMSLLGQESRRKRHEASAAQAGSGQPESVDGDLGVYEALARLPLRYRTMLEAKYLQQRTLAEIAQTEGRSIEAIESLLRRARARFAEVYEKRHP